MTLIRLRLPRDYEDRVLLLQRWKYWLEDSLINFYFEIEDEQHLPTLLYVDREEDAIAFKLKFEQ